ncbi:cadherin-24-like [Lampetra planeri]
MQLDEYWTDVGGGIWQLREQRERSNKTSGGSAGEGDDDAQSRGHGDPCRCACQTGGGDGRAAVSLARFERRAFVFTVPEDSAPGSTVGTVSAASPEPGLLADFSLADDDDAGGDTFLVDRRSGAIRLLRSLDREARPFYALTLSVTAVPAGDSRNPPSGGGGELGVASGSSAPLGNPLDASAGDGDSPRVAGNAGNSDGSGTLARVYVSVLDANDNAPAFASSRLEVEVCEDAALGAAVVSLNASDPDEALGLSYGSLKTGSTRAVGITVSAVGPFFVPSLLDLLGPFPD